MPFHKGQKVEYAQEINTVGTVSVPVCRQDCTGIVSEVVKCSKPGFPGHREMKEFYRYVIVDAEGAKIPNKFAGWFQIEGVWNSEFAWEEWQLKAAVETAPANVPEEPVETGTLDVPAFDFEKALKAHTEALDRIQKTLEEILEFSKRYVLSGHSTKASVYDRAKF